MTWDFNTGQLIILTVVICGFLLLVGLCLGDRAFTRVVERLVSIIYKAESSKKAESQVPTISSTEMEQDTKSPKKGDGPITPANPD